MFRAVGWSLAQVPALSPAEELLEGILAEVEGFSVTCPDSGLLEPGMSQACAMVKQYPPVLRYMIPGNPFVRQNLEPVGDWDRRGTASVRMFLSKEGAGLVYAVRVGGGITDEVASLVIVVSPR